MTSTFTILCSEGIVMGADSRITYQGRTFDSVQKIYQMKKTQIGVSYWGYVGFNDHKTVLEHLITFEKICVKTSDTVDDVSEKLKEYLQHISPKISDTGGFHVAGCVNQTADIPYRLRHVFHETWHDVGEFTNENCHIEYHDSRGNRVAFEKSRKYPVLFNGDNFVANALFNYAPAINNGFRINTDLLTLGEAIELSQLILEIAVKRLAYFFGPNQRRALPTTGGQIFISKITCKNGFEWVKSRQDSKVETTPIDNFSFEEFFGNNEKMVDETSSLPHMIGLRPSNCNPYEGSICIYPIPKENEKRVVGFTQYLPISNQGTTNILNNPKSVGFRNRNSSTKKGNKKQK